MLPVESVHPEEYQLGVDAPIERVLRVFDRIGFEQALAGDAPARLLSIQLL